MTVAQLIEELKKWPQDMPIATMQDIGPSAALDPHWIKVSKKTWMHSNWPYDKPDFDYVDLE